MLSICEEERNEGKREGGKERRSEEWFGCSLFKVRKEGGKEGGKERGKEGKKERSKESSEEGEKERSKEGKK